ncbi:hypothetical protein Btru_065521 [Bulinus truncatus]|nr:hypothetical protein Btru_065521 [Bulinus truncatus]
MIPCAGPPKTKEKLRWIQDCQSLLTIGPGVLGQFQKLNTLYEITGYFGSKPCLCTRLSSCVDTLLPVTYLLCYHLSRGDLAIFGVSNASSLATIQSYTDTFNVPFVSISMPQNISNNNSYQIYMRPMYINALVDVMFHYKWQSVDFLYDTDEDITPIPHPFNSTTMSTSESDVTLQVTERGFIIRYMRS